MGTNGCGCGCAGSGQDDRDDDCDCGCHGDDGDSRSCDAKSPVDPGAQTPDSVFLQTFNTNRQKFGKIADRTTQVDVCGDKNITLELPCSPRFGRWPLTINNTGNGTITLKSDDRDIVGQDSNGQVPIPPESSATLNFSRCGKCGIWSILYGENVNQEKCGGGLIVPNLAALAALDLTGCPDLTRVLVQTKDQYYELDRESTDTPDGNNVVAAVGGGNWLRLYTFSAKWASQIFWFVDPVNGNDENGGESTLDPLLTPAEVFGRLTLAKSGKNYQIQILNQPTGPSTVSADAAIFRPSFVSEPDVENNNAGTPQIFNFTLLGSRFVSGSGSLTDYVPTTAAYPEPALGNQAHIVATSLGGAGVGDMIVLTNGPFAGATAFIGKLNITPNTHRISDFTLPNNAAAGAITATATTFNVVKLTNWLGSFVQVGNQGRYQVQDFRFPDIAGTAPIVNQEQILYRNVSVTWRTCQFERISKPAVGPGIGAFQPSFGVGTTIAACCFNYSAAVGGSPGGMVFQSQIGGATAMGFGTLILNCDYCFTLAAVVFIFGVYLQGSMLRDATSPNLAADYGANAPIGATRGVDIEITNSPGSAAGSNGLGIYDTPAAAPAGLLVSDDACVRVQGNLYGSVLCGDGTVVRSSAKMLVVDTVLPSLKGTTNEVRIDNPPGGGLFAQWQPTPLAGGATVITSDLLNVWGGGGALAWNNPAKFNRYAFNLATGASIASVPAS